MKKIWFDSDMISEEQSVISTYDTAIVRGYGVCDFISVHNGKALFKDEHIERFINSQNIVRLEPQYTADQLSQAIDAVINENNLTNQSIKLIRTGGLTIDGIHQTTAGNTIVQPEDLTVVPDDVIKKGIAVATYKHEREFPEAKTLAYITRLIIQSDLESKNFSEVLYHNGTNVLEASTSNVFIVKNGEVITPKQGVLHGITRRHVIDCAKTAYTVRERAITLQELFDADEVFITATNKKVMPIIRIDDTPVGNGTPGDITLHLFDLYNESRSH